ncbi:MAG: AarF/UbiB family protein, partial [Bacteroidota bacterium]
RIITMDWMEGKHLSEFAKCPFSRELGNQLGQTLWDFYMFQIHGLRKVHADPHPGNFMVDPKGVLIALDFGCIKEIPEDFYRPYFELAEGDNLDNAQTFTQKLYELEILTPTDSPEELRFFTALFGEMLRLFTAPFQQEEFDFASDAFWTKIAELSERYSKDQQIRKMNGNRGSKHFLYMNRTFFGLYNLLHDLKAKVRINHFRQYLVQGDGQVPSVVENIPK